MTSIVRPTLLALKLVTTWTLPEKFGIAGSSMDMLLGLKGRLSHMGTLANLMSTAADLQVDLIGNVENQRASWALETFREAWRESWNVQEIVEDQRQLVEGSQVHLERINALHVAFDAAVVAEVTLHENYVPRAQRAWEERMAWLVADAAQRSEQRRRTRMVE